MKPTCETPLCKNEAVTTVNVPNLGEVFVCGVHAPAGSVATK